jgi:hypothetical protein
MKIISTAIVSLIISGAALAAPDATMQADNQAINTACAADAQTAGCGGEVVGKGLLKCLWHYKHSNPSFKFSETCKAAMKQRHQDKEAGK